jgi:selenide,water dikinase
MAGIQTKDLVLIGGGHSHAIALKRFGMKPLPGVQLTLITDVCDTPYSGMLPGYVAGLYSFDECHIDLRPLTQFAGARMIVDRASALDLDHHRVICAHRPALPFDLLSIDIGSMPATLTVPGAAEHAIPVKPISKFLTHWEQLVAEVRQHPDRPLQLATVGGGAGGVELALSLQSHLHRLYQAAHQPPTTLEMHLFQRDQRLLPTRHPWVGQRLQQILTQRGVALHLNEHVWAIEGRDKKVIRCESGLNMACDRIFWVTQAAAAPWLQESGLATDSSGFILVSDTLQSISHPQVFAAGDVATMVYHPRPKAGVFAVRQGNPLFHNLRRVLLEKPPKPFVPQREFLILVGTGDRQAIASRGPFGCGPSPLIWRWKDHIDRKFMHQFRNLKPMEMGNGTPQTSNAKPPPSSFKAYSSSLVPPTTMRCAGCGSKVGATILERSLTRLKQDLGNWALRSDVLIGLDTPDDAAVVSVPAGQVMVQTIDYFRALIDDPFRFGQITANHCLSDLFAMGAVPQSALAIATLPYGPETKVEETLYQLLSGAIKVLGQAQAVLIGGHTTEGAELSFGLSCNGLADLDKLLRNSNMQPGQALILTKALGTGTLFAADMQLKAKGRWIEAAIQSMLLSNQAAAVCFQEHQATACTDITGFGLLGHLLEMVSASHVAVELNLSAIPVLDGAQETIQSGILSSLHSQNLRAAASVENLERIVAHPLYPLLFDPQTSGGLLATVPEERAIACLSALKASGYPHSSLIGYVLPQQEGSLPVRIR